MVVHPGATLEKNDRLSLGSLDHSRPMGYQKTHGYPAGHPESKDQQLTSLGNVPQGIFTVTITRIGSNPKYASNFEQAFADSKPKKKGSKKKGAKKKGAKKKNSRKSKR